MADTETKTEAAPKLKFEKPERRVRKIFSVKAISPNGDLVQLPVADQINNHVSSPESMVGLRFYERKGFKLLWDFDKGKGAYCPAGDCYAEWKDEFNGFCSKEHQATLAKKDTPGRFDTGATTTRTAWTAPE